MSNRFYELVWDVTGDVADAHGLALWWAAVLGGDVVREDEWSSVEGVEGLPFESSSSSRSRRPRRRRTGCISTSPPTRSRP